MNSFKLILQLITGPGLHLLIKQPHIYHLLSVPLCVCVLLVTVHYISKLVLHLARKANAPGSDTTGMFSHWTVQIHQLYRSNLISHTAMPQKYILTLLTNAWRYPKDCNWLWCNQKPQEQAWDKVKNKLMHDGWTGRTLACKDIRHQSYFCCLGQCAMHIANLMRQQHKMNLRAIESEQTYLCNILILCCFR